MAVDQNYLDFILDQLSEFGEVETKKMFGGIGFFEQGRMFGMITGKSSCFRLKVDEFNKEDYVAKGMEPLFMKNKKKGMPYWEVPADVLEDKETLAVWVTKSIEASLRNVK